MEFRHSTTEGMNLIHLTDENNTLLTIAPDHGAKLCSLKLKASEKLYELLWPVSVDDLRSDIWYKNTILFPYPNRLNGGKYTFENKSYQFPINEPDKNNQLHGMVYNASFEVKEQRVETDHAEITCGYHYHGKETCFPFPFDLKITYQYHPDEFTVHFYVKNTGYSNLPFGLGWHPYFQIDGAPVNDYCIRVPQLTILELNERSIPTGKELDYPNRTIDLDFTKLDNTFRIVSGPREYRMEDRKSGISLAMKASEGFDYLQIFTPPGDESVAIEPMTCNVNAFNNHQGLRVLKPSEKFKGSFRIRLKC